MKIVRGTLRTRARKKKKRRIYLLLESCELVPFNFLFLADVAFFDLLGSSSMAISAKLRSSPSPVL